MRYKFASVIIISLLLLIFFLFKKDILPLLEN